MNDLDQHIEAIRERVRERLEELGLARKLPSTGVIRIIHEVLIEYWGKEMEEDEEYGGAEEEVDPHLFRFELRPVEGNPFLADAKAVTGIDPEGNSIVVGLVAPEGVMYFAGHKVVVGEEQKVESYHADGSYCPMGCRGCKEPDARLVACADGEVYVRCLHCGTHSDLYEEIPLAVGAWVVGKVTHEEATDGA